MWFAAFRFLVKKYNWVHNTIGVIGGILFVIGSALFLADRSTAAGILFIAGSSGMLLGNVGQMIADYQWEAWQKER